MLKIPPAETYEMSSDVASLVAWIDALNYILNDSKSLLMTGS
jgi:hypothetical protein